MPYNFFMNYIPEFNEYYDELYPITEDLKCFFDNLISQYSSPVKFLRIGCGTGYFEHYLSKLGHDVTGIEDFQEMLESANRRRKFPNMAIRYFFMSSLEMARFLGKNFYNIITIKDNRIIFTHDPTLMRKFFYDCKNLLAPDGKIVIQMNNFKLFTPNPSAKLPLLESMRAKLFSQLWQREEGQYTIDMNLETSTGRILSLLKDTKVLPLTREQIQELALEAGFSSIEYYANYRMEKFTEDSENIIAVIS